MKIMVEICLSMSSIYHLLYIYLFALMNSYLQVILVLGAYLLGSIPFGLFFTWISGAGDVRKIGSGNIGATNVLRTGRKGLAAATLLCDMLKATVAVIVAGYFGGPNAAMAAALGDAVILTVAEDPATDALVAGALHLRGADALYGRNWGAAREVPFLHFELCYYRFIEYCIERGLTHFDAGAQGEHKVPRGFVPIKTWSTHWIADPGFRRAVAEFLTRETRAVDRYVEDVAEHTAYRRDPAAH